MRAGSASVRPLAGLIAASLLAIAGGCGDGDSSGPEPGANLQARLDEARGRWQASGIVDYRYRYTRLCECPPEDLTSPAIEVRAGAIVRVWDVTTGAEVDPANFDRYFSVTDLFDLIQAAIDLPADEVSVTYHPALGHPTALLIDYQRSVADEEIAIPLIGGVQELVTDA